MIELLMFLFIGLPVFTLYIIRILKRRRAKMLGEKQASNVKEGSK